MCVAPGVDLATPYVLHALEVEENGNLTCPRSRTLMALRIPRGVSVAERTNDHLDGGHDLAHEEIRIIKIQELRQRLSIPNPET